MEVSFGLVTAEAPEVEAKKLAEVLLDNTVDKTRWKMIILQNISKLLNVVVEDSPGAINSKCPVYQHSY